MKRTVLNLNYCVIIITTIILSSSFRANAQLTIGGDVSSTFINGVNIDFAPVIGYKFKIFTAGLSPVGQYTAQGNTGGDFSYGGRLFAEVVVVKGIFIHAECEALNTGYINASGLKLRNWVIGAPIGLGYEYLIAKHVLAKAMVLYNVLLDINLNQNSPKSNPTARIGLTYVF